MKVVLTTIDTKESAEKLGRSIVAQRLAACVNVVSGLSSIYWWEGEVQQAEEWLLVIKTVPEQLDPLEQHLRENHPYDLPEFVVLDPTAVSAEYGEWVRSSTRG